MTSPLPQQRLLIQTPTAQLEGLAFTAPHRTGGAAAVILHPYALLGGSMNDPMVKELFRCAPLPANTPVDPNQGVPWHRRRCRPAGVACISRALLWRCAMPAAP